MSPPTGSAQHCLALAVQHVNAGQPERAKQLCEHALATCPADAAVLQLLALLRVKAGELERATHSIEASLQLRPDHGPSQLVAGDVARARADLPAALALHDTGDLAGAETALRQVLTLVPARAEVEVNLGIVLQEARRMDEAMRAYGRAYRMREDSFGRIAHALTAAPVGRLWLDLDRPRDTLRDMPA